MSMSISAKGTNLFNYFAIAQENKIVIPEYQRPYAWESDHVQILFEDLWNYNKEHLNNSKAPPYFLGCIVSYKNDKDEQEIIDGQQRLTTLFLLFRAILAAIENFPVDPDLEAIVRKIKSSIYKNRGVADTPDPKQPLIESKVINQTYNNVLSDILENGLLKTGATDPYSTNYSLLLKLVKEVACKDRDCFYEIVDSLLKKTIVLPITTDSEETALTIFMTMNDRGLQLTDADIFKANIYSQKSELERKTFIDHWKKLEERGMNCKLSLQSLFTYFMFYLKALNGDKKGTIEGVRKFYLADPEKRLYQEDLIPQLNKIIDLWNVIFYRKNLDGELWTKDIKILKSLDTLRSYPNEWWKYPVICFYLRHRNANDFESFFGLFLNRLIGVLTTRYLAYPNVNAVKPGVLKLNVAIMSNIHPIFESEEELEENYENNIAKPHDKLTQLMLKIRAYQSEAQTELLPEGWEVEHIFPQTWEPNYPMLRDKKEEIKEIIEHMGNKIPLEEALNIKASNGYFDSKKKIYRESKVAVARELATQRQSDWNLDQIAVQDYEFTKSFKQTIKTWKETYFASVANSTRHNEPNAEEMAQIAALKAKFGPDVFSK